MAAPRDRAGRPWDLWLAEAAPRPAAPDPKPRQGPGGARLPASAMCLYGRAPALDRLFAAVCHLCGDVVKCCAAEVHLRERHGGGGGDQVPAPPPPRARPLSTRVSATPPHLLRPPAPPPPPPASSQPKLEVRVEEDEPPVVSIRDVDDDVPRDTRADDIIEIMNSEGIRADDAPPVKPVEPPVEPRSRKRVPRPPPKSKGQPREYDPDRHCGVTQGEGRKPCTRSLTCKSHALSLRRTVEGRAKPFDALLADHRAAKRAPAVVPPPPEPEPERVPPPPVQPPPRPPDPVPSPSPPPPSPPPPPVVVADPEPVERRSVSPPNEQPECRPNEVHWYASRPRPLAACTFSARHVGNSLSLSGRLAAVRSDFKAASRSGADQAAAGSRAISFSQAKRSAPELRRLVMACSAFGGRGLFSVTPDAKRARSEAPDLMLNKRTDRNDMLELNFVFDPLVADEKC